MMRFFHFGRALAVLALPASAVLALTLAGCSSENPPPAGNTTDASPRSGTPSPSDSVTPATPTSETPVTLEVAGRTITGHLGDSATARSLLDQLPLTLSFRDYAGQEKIAKLPAALDLNGAPARSAAPALTIGYYVPDRALILYYTDIGSFSGIVPIGTYDTAAPLQDQTGTFPVTIRSTR